MRGKASAPVLLLQKRKQNYIASLLLPNTNLNSVIVVSDNLPSGIEHFRKCRDLQAECMEALYFSKELHYVGVKVHQELPSVRMMHKQGNLQSCGDRLHLHGTCREEGVSTCLFNLNMHMYTVSLSHDYHVSH